VISSGYGPNPNEAVSKVRGLKSTAIRGNHDRVASGQDTADDFNAHARAAAYWTRDALSEESAKYLRELPVGPYDLGGGAQLVHGAVTDEDDYIMSEVHAVESFDLTDARLTFFGHTHYPSVFSCDPDGNVLQEIPKSVDGFLAVDLKKTVQYMINPGSVGQPRDNDTRAAFGIWDIERSRMEFHRVEYPLEITQEKMRAEGLPQYLIDRLRYGR
jgi:diadenosine tetraphosphatase ApaH/serine/threonine PP2A family protein phosphatase